MGRPQPNTGKEVASLNFSYNSATNTWEPVENSSTAGQKVELLNPLTAFGEMSVAINRAFIQAAPVNGLLPSNFRVYNSGTGSSAGVSGNEFSVSSGTTAGGYGAVQSFRALNYKAGEAGLIRFTARFPLNAANSWQGAGGLNLGDELSFGYNGTNFGIWHRYHGKAEVRLLTISNGASGAETATIFVNGTSYAVPLTSGTAAHNAKEIEAWFTTNVTTWTAWQNGSTVTFASTSDGAKSNTFSFASTGTADASWSTLMTGVAKTSDFYNQDEWNQDTMPDLDPSKGNVYQINYQYLGYGNIFFSIEDPDTGRFKLVHLIKIANQKTKTSLGNPSLRLGLYATNITGTTNLDVYCGSFAAFIQGEESQTRNPRAAKNTKSVSSTTLTNILTIRNKRVLNGHINQTELTPYFLSIASEAAKTVSIEIYSNATISGSTNYANAATNSIVEVDKSGTTVSGGILLGALTVPPNGTLGIDLTPYRLRIPPTLTFTIAAYLNGGAASDVSASLTWYEDN